MKLLFDEDISFRILKKIANVFPDSVQIDRAGLKGHSDRDVWNFAKTNKYTIVSFDEDFFEMILIRSFG